jgi:hypothetical protein
LDKDPPPPFGVLPPTRRPCGPCWREKRLVSFPGSGATRVFPPPGAKRLWGRSGGAGEGVFLLVAGRWLLVAWTKTPLPPSGYSPQRVGPAGLAGGRNGSFPPPGAERRWGRSGEAAEGVLVPPASEVSVGGKVPQRRSRWGRGVVPTKRSCGEPVVLSATGSSRTLSRCPRSVSTPSSILPVTSRQRSPRSPRA